MKNLQKMVHRELLSQFETAYDLSKTFKLDYKNTCKWYKNYELMPIKLAFFFADYLNMRLVVFRDNK